MESRFHYQYPSNLNEKPKIGPWYISELVIVVIVFMFSLLFALNIRSWYPLVAGLGCGFLLAHIDERSALQHLITLILYLKDSNIWEYNPGPSRITASVQAQANAGSEKAQKKMEATKKKNQTMIGILIGLAVIFGVVMVRTNNMAEQDAAKENAKATEKADSTASASASPDSGIVLDGSADVEFIQDAVTVNVGDRYDPNDNIESITDDKETAYTRVRDSKKLTNGTYFIQTSQLKLDTPGTYTVSVLARDSEGKLSGGTFDVVVQDSDKDSKTDSDESDTSVIG